MRVGEKKRKKKGIMSPVTTELPKKPINNSSVANFTVLRVVRLWRNKAVFSTHPPCRCCSATGSQIRPMALIIQPVCRPFLAPPVDRGARERARARRRRICSLNSNIISRFTTFIPAMKQPRRIQSQAGTKCSYLALCLQLPSNT